MISFSHSSLNLTSLSILKQFFNFSLKMMCFDFCFVLEKVLVGRFLVDFLSQSIVWVCLKWGTFNFLNDIFCNFFIFSFLYCHGSGISNFVMIPWKISIFYTIIDTTGETAIYTTIQIMCYYIIYTFLIICVILL